MPWNSHHLDGSIISRSNQRIGCEAFIKNARLSTMTPALKEATSRAVRTLLQLFASGGLTALVALLFARHMNGAEAAIWMGAFQVAVTFTHNFLEDAGIIPKLLKNNTSTLPPPTEPPS